MAVEAFLKPGDVKMTIEKEVRQKPTLSELTTVETPGRPTPLTDLEELPKKKAIRRKRTEKVEPSEITPAKRDSVLIITEKPQAAAKIAQALGNNRKFSENNVPYYELEKDSKKIIVASAVGHLFNLTYVSGQKGWPIFQVEWQPSHLTKSATFTKRYFDTLKKLSRRASEIIIATDFDVEGEVIGWNVLRFICKQKTAKRMKYSTLTSAELLNSYEHLLSEPHWGNAYAGETRHILDWLYGINLSRALMSAIKTTGSFKILSIGRVQGPALKMIVDREKEIQSFKPIPYWQVFANTNGIELKHPSDIFDKSLLEKFKNIKEGNAETKKSEEKTLPPVPFDLTTLQREAYRLFKFSPSETLQIAQRLYLDGLISYPRTSSQKIPKEIQPKKILKALEKNFPEAKNAIRPFPMEGKKSDPAHPSIYPTGEHSALKERDEKLYALIVKRFIAAFSKDVLTSNTRIVVTAIDKKGNPQSYIPAPEPASTNISNKDDDEENEKIKEIETKKEKEINFTTSGFTILEKGWSLVYPITFEESTLPELKGKVIIDSIRTIEKETQPPNRFSPTSLVSLLEKKNLGTKSTRSMIVDTLFDRGYLDGRSIQATQLGMQLIKSLETYSPIIIDEHLTRQLEEELEKIQESKSNFEYQEKQVLEKAERLITDIAKEFKVKEIEIGKELLKGIEHMRADQQEANTLILCSTCKQGKLRIMYSKKTRRYFIGCSKYPDCKQTFSLPPNALIKKSEKICEADNFPKLLAIRKAKRPWEFCFNPNCPIETQKRAEREEKYKNKDAEEE
ncbi:MAG: DNA topoisomerase [Nanoarchaeota archaeon]